MMNRRNLLRASFGSALLFALPACGDGDSASATSSDEPRMQADPLGAKLFAEGISAFTWDLYRQIATEPGNIFISPYSVAMAMAQVTAGARGDMAKQLHKALHTETFTGQAAASAGALDLALDTAATGDNTFRLSTANSAWAQQSFTFEQAYLDLLARSFGSEMFVTDFEKDAEKSRLAINEWVEEQTEDKIQDLLPKDSLTADTRLVLANAIYFNARWQDEFHPSFTTEEDFTRLDRSIARAQLMSRRGNVAYAEMPGAAAIELPYKDGRFAMLIILPEEGDFEKVESGLHDDRVTDLIGGLKQGDTLVSLPKFAFSFEKPLKPAFQAMDADLAFEPGRADFSGITTEAPLVIDEVYHKAIVRTDERGTEASAATGAVAMQTSMPRLFRADRPFLFLIRDTETGAILFAGRVVEPVFDA